MTTREQFVAEARRWLGTRWQHQGRTMGRARGHGVDCAGLLTQTARAVGPLSPATIDDLEASIAGYGRIPQGDMLRKGCDKYMRRLPFAEVQQGDIALMRFAREPQHLGVLSVVGDGFGLIHALAAARKVVEHRLDSLWRDRVVAFYSVF